MEIKNPRPGEGQGGHKKALLRKAFLCAAGPYFIFYLYSFS
jgi:hypothetical protein